MTSVEARIIAASFVALTAWPFLLGVTGVRGAAIENRRLTEAPSFSLARLGDQRFYTTLSEFLNDHLPLRDVMVRAHSQMAIHIWKDSPSPAVHIGRGDWLFETSFRAICPDKMPLGAVGSLATLGRSFRTAGREMRFVLAPSKATVYPEFLGAFPPADFECGIQRFAEVRRTLSVMPDLGFIDMWAHLRRLKPDASEPLYFDGDSHWTLQSAAEMSRAIVDSIEPGLWRDDDVVVSREILLPMDLARMIGVPRSVPTSLNETRRPGVTSRIVETQDCRDEGPNCVVRYRSVADHEKKLIAKRTLLVRDSFGTMSMATLAPYFADITFLFWSADLQQQLAARVGEADLVVYETLDAYLFERLNRGFTRLRIPPRDAKPSAAKAGAGRIISLSSL